VESLFSFDISTLLNAGISTLFHAGISTLLNAGIHYLKFPISNDKGRMKKIFRRKCRFTQMVLPGITLLN
jgi:hypothetical protein